MKCIPNMYKKDIFSIPYDKLKESGIKCLIFDLDNTLALLEQKECPLKVKKLIRKLQKDFFILIITNNIRKRVIPYERALGVSAISFAMKPLTRGLREARNKYNLKKKEMVMIGDQIITDVISGNNFRIKTILVDPLGKKDLKITSLNRYIENKIIERYSKKGIFKRGSYYEW